MIMELKYPIGIQTFDKIREDGYVYVDKTDMIYSLTHSGTIYFLSRPRRFGKSLLVSTLKNYYLGRRDLFKGLAIDKLEKDWNTYPVFHIDFNADMFSQVGSLDETLEAYVSRWEKEYGIEREYPMSVGRRFAYVMEKAHRQTGLRCVVLIDEYDKPILDVIDSKAKVAFHGDSILLEDYNRNVLKAFYSTFKLADKDVQFVLLTGVTKFSQVSVFSGFNQPDDISMSNEYAALCGITDEEIKEYFDVPVCEMANYYHCSYNDMVAALKKQYDGYHFSDEMIGVYNPFSLLNAFKYLRIQDYWFRTGTPTYLVRLLRHFNENLNELTGKYYLPEQFVDYRADVEKPLPMIFQSGYLTIKDYDVSLNAFMLDFPNDEVKRGFVTLLANNYLQPEESVDSWLITAVMMLKQGDTDAFRKQLTSFLASIPYTMRRKDTEREKERYFHYTFYLLLRLLSTFVTYTEKQQSQGRVDCIIETGKFVYIFEFKLDGTAAEAIRQIEKKGYAEEYSADKRKVFKIGVSFSSETGTVDDWQMIEG